MNQLREASEFWHTADPIRWHVMDDRSKTTTIRKFYGQLYAEAVRILGRVPERVVDWGCGGGMAAAQMMARGTLYYGVDIVQTTLDACTLALENAAGLFTPVLVDIEDPEACLDAIEPCDLFVCLTVYQHFPDRDYAERITRLVSKLLVPDGLAIIQTRQAMRPRENDTRPYKARWVGAMLMNIREFEGMAGDAGLTVEDTWTGENWSLDYQYHFCRRAT